ncbi:MAG: hypothetical protein JWP72_371 [Massilia sp.]|nr:hypothetical protein [Massilia sp.]MDB5793330.1 hypothetical protein [Massilia sp.]
MAQIIARAPEWVKNDSFQDRQARGKDRQPESASRPQRVPG